MKKLLFVSLLCAALLGAFVVPAFTADAPTGPVTFKVPDAVTKTKTMAPFTHDNHKQDCVVCHHTWDGSAEIQSCSSAGCHDQDGKKGENSYYGAFHDRKAEASCVGCHKAEKKGPKSCKDCHPKE